MVAERMERKAADEYTDTAWSAFFTGPSETDGALQAQCIEDPVSQGVDAICVVPFSTESLEPVLKSQRRGIICHHT